EERFMSRINEALSKGRPAGPPGDADATAANPWDLDDAAQPTGLRVEPSPPTGLSTADEPAAPPLPAQTGAAVLRDEAPGLPRPRARGEAAEKIVSQALPVDVIE